MKGKATIATAKIGLFEQRTEWQARADKDLDMEHVERLVCALDEGHDLPPIRVVKLSNGALGIVDGYHRLGAYVMAHRELVPFEIVGHGEECIGWHLARANAENGRARTIADKRLAVRRALSAPEGVNASNAAIARWVGVSDELVRDIRVEMRGAPSAAAERREVLDGAREQAPDIKIPRSTAHDRKGSASESPVTGDSDRQPSAPAEPAPGWQALADACDRVADAISALRRALSAELREVPGAQEIVEHLDRARAVASKRKPTACPAPHGRTRCPICDGRGYTLGAYPGDWRAVVAAKGAR